MCTFPADPRDKREPYPTKATCLKPLLLLSAQVFAVSMWAQEAPPPDTDFQPQNPFGASAAPAPATPTPGVPAAGFPPATAMPPATPTPSAGFPAATPAPAPGFPAASAPATGTTPGATSRFQQGNPFEKAKVTGAAVDLSQAPGLDPSMQETELLAYALRARSEGNIPAARAAFQTLLARDPNNPQYARLLSSLPAHDVPPTPIPPSQFTPPAPQPPAPNDLLGGTAPVINFTLDPTPPTSPTDIVINPNPGPMIPGEVAPGTAAPTGQPPIVDTPSPEPSQPDDLMGIDLSGLDEALEAIDNTRMLKDKMRGFKDDFKNAKKQIKDHEFAEANQSLSKLKTELEAMGGEDAGKLLEDVDYELSHILLYKAIHDIDQGFFELAADAIDTYERNTNGQDKESQKARQRLKRAQRDPYMQSIENVSKGFINQQADLANLLVRAKTQYVNGDYEGALETYRTIDLLFPNSKEAKYYQLIIAEQQKEVSTLDRKRTVEMLKAIISGKWQMPVVKNRRLPGESSVVSEEESPVAKKLKSIIIPEVNLTSIELTRAIAFLSQASVAFDFDNNPNVPKGVNIIPNFDPSVEDPLVNLTLRNMSLERVLEVMVDQVDYDIELTPDAVLISKGTSMGPRNYILEFFPISPNTILKLTGGTGGAGGAPGGGAGADPFAPAPGGGAGLGGGGGNAEEEAMKNFFIRAGIPLDDPDSSFAFDGQQLIVRHTQRVHSMIQDILRRYDTEQTQVEIEAKFLEVQQGDLEELGFNWGFHYGEGDPLLDTETGKPKKDSRGYPILEHRIGFTPQNRTLSDAFTFSSNSSKTTISRGDDVTEYDNSPPRLPNTLDLANNSGNVFKTLASVAQGSSTILGAAQVDLVIKALQRSSGTELLSAPRVTVNNEGQANITIAQEFRYPEDYDPGQIAQSGTGFTGAVPNTFVDRNVGVELAVNPTVLPNDTITLHLEPTVTEFEGFVEYGGNNVVISGAGIGGGAGGVGGVGGGLGGFGGGFGGNQEPVVIVQPSGIYQPIFSVRRVVTDVTIYDGATVVIGGLTREEVKTVNDRVPVLSNIPGIGRLFRSEGESSLKRNLMIFVTGNIISPGGGPARQDLATIQRGSVYQNPIVITPAGPERRVEGTTDQN